MDDVTIPTDYEAPDSEDMVVAAPTEYQPVFPYFRILVGKDGGNGTPGKASLHSSVHDIDDQTNCFRDRSEQVEKLGVSVAPALQQSHWLEKKWK